MKNLISSILVLLIAFNISAQDTTIIQTVTYDSLGRDYMFEFPSDDNISYEKVMMLYSMRCKDGLISTQSQPNQGCGEWDYSCNTFITDSSKTDSVKAVHLSHIISGFSGSSYNYTLNPTFDFYSFTQHEVSNSGLLTENEGLIGEDVISSNFPFSTSEKIGKSQYLITASELTEAGLISEQDLSSLSLNVTEIGSDAMFLKIKIKSTSLTEFDNSGSLNTDGFTEVYFNNTSFENLGLNTFEFYTPFNWDGSSNLIIEFTYSNATAGTNTLLNASNSLYNSGLESSNMDSYIDIESGHKYAEIDNALDLGSDQDFTIEMWVKPSQYQNDPSIVSDKNWASGSNKGFIIAQNGNTWKVNIGDGSDRKDVTGGTITDGEWHHLAVSFDRNGLMILYQDGINVGQTSISSIGDINSGLSIKMAQDGTGVYSIDWVGKMDEFRFWNSALSSTEIQEWRYKNIDSSHPQYDNLETYYNFNEDSGLTLIDLSGNENHGSLMNVPSRKSFRSEELFKGFNLSTTRPNISLHQNTYSSTVISDFVTLDSTMNAANTIYSFDVLNNELIALDTQAFYLSGYKYIYEDYSEVILDSVFYETENTIEISNLIYYNKYPSIFEIMSFVTPYGKGLDLGLEGKTWQFDVTDLLPILKGNKRMNFTGGVNQEDLDIKFLFIEGTPIRDVIDVQQVWRAGSHRNYTDIMSNKYFETRTVQPAPSSSMYKVRVAITGHGQEGEFIPRNHFININGGPNDFQWQVWKECADNPIFPQGGTWVYDRAGWCPGEATDMQEFEISNLVNANAFDIDYGVTAGSGDSRYLVNCQLVSYGNPNFSLDASLVEIQRPSKRIEYDRVNPVCYHPTVVIRNTGATALTSLTISYGVSGGTAETYTWIGNLAFDEKATVELPLPNAGFWLGDDNHVFTATLSAPNGGVDEYANCNSQSSEFDLPDMYNEPFYIFLKTNNRGWENSYQVKDFEGNVVFSKTNLSNSTSYRDTLLLTPGCYTLEVLDTGEDGLQWWANSAQGNGFIRLFDVSTGSLLKNFEADFGNNFKYSFVVDNFTYIENKGKGIELNIYPNPTTGKVLIDFENDAHEEIKISFTDITGRKVFFQNLKNIEGLPFEVDLSNEAPGIYFCNINTNEKTITKKFIKTN